VLASDELNVSRLGKSLRYWPPVALVTAFVVGAVLSGVGGGVLALTLAVLVVGPGYLIQQQIRRRGSVPSSGHRLERDADEFTAGVADRYRPVRLKRQQRSALLRAGIEDTQATDVIRVADAGMAIYLAWELNALDRGESLPAAGEPHYPVRFQLIHDLTGLTPTVGVVYVHRSRSRMVAAAPSDACAQTIAQILNHVDYPMVETQSWLLTTQPGEMIKNVPELPDTSMPPRKTSVSRLRATGYVLTFVLPFALLLSLLAVVSWPYALAAVVGYAVFYLVVQALLRRS
jgi:hypothetical protein